MSDSPQSLTDNIRRKDCIAKGNHLAGLRRALEAKVQPKPQHTPRNPPKDSPKNLPGDRYQGLLTNAPAKQPRQSATPRHQPQPAPTNRDTRVVDLKGKGKQKAEPDQSTLTLRVAFYLRRATLTSRSRPAPSPRPLAQRQPTSVEPRRTSGRLSNRHNQTTTLSDDEDVKPAPRKSPALVPPVDRDTV